MKKKFIFEYSPFEICYRSIDLRERYLNYLVRNCSFNIFIISIISAKKMLYHIDDTPNICICS